MAVLEPRNTHESAAGSTFTPSLATQAVRALLRLAMILKHRQQIASLAQLDDRALKDIGLMRTDVRAALSSPFYRDPSVQLISVAGYKRVHHDKVNEPAGQSMDRLRRPAPAITSGLPC